MTGQPAQSRRSPHLIVCGDNALAYSLVRQLATQDGDDLTVIMPSVAENFGPRIAALKRVRVVATPELSETAFRSAEVTQARAVALVAHDDIGNLHAALRVRDLNRALRLVIRLSNTSLGDRIRELVPGCEVLSDADAAAPSFVNAALGKAELSLSVRLHDRTLYVAKRAGVPADRVICGLSARSPEHPEHPELLPTDPDDADQVLAWADGDAFVGDSPRRRGRELLRTWWLRIAVWSSRKLAITTFALLALLVLGAVPFSIMGGLSWADALYLSLLDAAGAAQPNIAQSAVEKITQAVVTIVGISIIPVVTATVVDAVVGARLATALGRPRPIKGHVVIVGLGDVGARVMGQLHDLGVPMVCVDRNENAWGVPLARRIGVPVVVGDASREEVLRAAYLGDSRALVAVTDDDLANLVAAMHGRAMSEQLRVVLRVLDGDLAKRVERGLRIAISRSVSDLAAPAFAAAMLGPKVHCSIPVGSRVLFLAEVPVHPGSQLEGRSGATLDAPSQARVIAIHPDAGGPLAPTASTDPPLNGGDRLIVRATRAGLAKIMRDSVASSAVMTDAAAPGPPAAGIPTRATGDPTG